MATLTAEMEKRDTKKAAPLFVLAVVRRRRFFESRLVEGLEMSKTIPL